MIKVVIAVLYLLTTLSLLVSPAIAMEMDDQGDSISRNNGHFTAYWQMNNSVHAGQTVDLVQYIEITRKLGVGSLIYIDQPVHYPGQLQLRKKEGINHIALVTGNVMINSRSVERDSIPGLPPGAGLLTKFEVVEGTLYPGERLILQYSNLKLPETAHRFSFPIYIGVTPDVSLEPVRVTTFPIKPGPPVKIGISAPSLIQRGDLFDVRLLITDQYDNPVSGSSISLEILVDGKFNRRVQTGDTAEIVIPGLQFEEDGLHYIESRSAGGGLVGKSNLISVIEKIEHRIAWVDLHLHDQQTGGLLSPGEIRTKYFTDLDVPLVISNVHAENIRSHEIMRPLAQGGNLLLLDHGTGSLQIPSGNIPVDHRRLNPELPVLTEILSGHSLYEWYGNQLAGYGYKVGFLATGTTHLPGEEQGRGKSAILVFPQETWIDALSRGRTYAVSAGKPILNWTLNNGLPGSRVTDSRIRKVAGKVHAPYNLDRIELLKNGNVIDQRLPGSTSETGRIQISLMSPSQPLGQPWELPRQGREWVGYLRVEGASIDNIEAGGYRENHQWDILVNPEDNQRIDFITWTQGDRSSFIVEIAQQQDDVYLELHIMAGTGRSSGTDTPAINQRVSLDNLQNGVYQRYFDAGDYKDQVEISLINRESINSYAFDFTDTKDIRAGDYYYLRIRGYENETIWSSPVYVGGFDVVE